MASRHPAPAPTDPSPTPRRQIRILYWIAAAALTLAIALEFVNPPVSYVELGSRLALLGALILLATARPAETRGKKVLIYALVLVAAVLLVVRLATDT